MRLHTAIPLLLLTATVTATLTASAQVYTQPQTPPPARPDKRQKAAPRENLEWLWQYSPADKNDHEGRENQLLQDTRFIPMIERNFTAPQTFWSIPIQGRYRSLSSTVIDFLAVPGKVLADDDRYLSISGCVVHFCPSRGLLWVDLNARQPLMIFAAIEWIKDGKATFQPAAEYTLWLFPNQPFTPTPDGQTHLPAPLIRSLARWSREPLAGSGIVQNITHAILVDPDGTPHELPITTVGVTPPPSP